MSTKYMICTKCNREELFGENEKKPVCLFCKRGMITDNTLNDCIQEDEYAIE